MELTRAQEQRISQLEEFRAETRQKFDVILGMLSRLQGNQRSDDQFTLDLSTTPSVKAKGSGSDHFERSGDDWRVDEEDRRFREYLMLRNDDDDETWTETDLLYRSEEENPEDQALNDEELVETEVATELIETEDRAVKNEANATMNSAIDKEEPISQFQVPGSDLEHGLRIHNASSIVCEDSQYVVGCDEWCDHQKSILQVSYVKEVEKLPQKSTSGNGEHVAHQLFDQKPLRVTHKEKHMKHLKAWRFKFKPTSKRSKLMDEMFSFVEETALLKKDPKETIWDCVRKGFKETMAACGKTRVDRFKLVHATPWPGVYDRPLQSSVWERGRSLLECVGEESFGDDKIKEWLFKVEEFFSIDFTPMELKVKLVSNHFDGDAANWHQSQVQTGQFGHLLTNWGAYKIVVNANLGFSDYNNKRMKGKTELLDISQKMQKMDFSSFGIHTEMEENVWLKQLLVAMGRVSREVIEQKIEGGLIRGDVKFHLKHKGIIRLLESFSRLVLLAWINLWLSKAYEFSGQLQDSSKGEAESFPFLNFAAGQHLLWMQNNSEPIFLVSEFERKKKLCYKTWMFKYKVDEEDQGILQSRTENSLSRREILTFIYQAEALLFESKEPAVSATQEPASFQSANAHGMITRGKEGIVKTNLRYSLLVVQRIWEKETHDVDITDAYYVLQEEFERVENHTPCSVVKWERPQDHDALLLPFPGDERFQIKHKWRFKLLLSILELELYLDSLVLITSYAHQFDIISLIILMRVELSVFFSTKPDGFFFSTNLEVKVSLKGEDVIQEKRRKKNGTCGT